MEPVTLAVVTSACTVLAKEVAKGAASEAGKSLWNKISSRLFSNSKENPGSEEIPAKIALKLKDDEELLDELIKLLKSNSEAGSSSSIVQNTDKIININQPKIEKGGLNIEM